MSGREEAEAHAEWSRFDEGIGVCTGVLKLFPQGGGVYPVDPKRRLWLDMAWCAGQEAGDDSNMFR